MNTMTPPPVPQHFEAADYLQLAVLVVAWLCVFAALHLLTRGYIRRGDVLARAEQIVDEHEDIESYVTEYLPTASQVAQTERWLAGKVGNR